MRSRKMADEETMNYFNLYWKSLTPLNVQIVKKTKAVMFVKKNITINVLHKKIEYIKELKEEIAELKTQIESMKKTLTEISEYADEKPIHNIAQKELDK